jgi:hypothetical protein
MNECHYDGSGSLVAYDKVHAHMMECPHGLCACTKSDCDFAAASADEDIPTELLPSSLQDEDDVAVKLKPNEVRTRPITRARAKLLKQLVNSLLNDTLIDKNFILLSLFTYV